MERKKGIVVLLSFICAIVLMSCTKPAAPSLKDEMNLVIKAGKNQMTTAEMDDLKKQNHPVLLQMLDPGTKPLIVLFANLPSGSHDELLEKGYLRWKFADLDPQRQQVWKDLVQLNIDMAINQGVATNPNFSQQALRDSDVGFAVVDIADGGTTIKVISLYIIWPANQPTWVTVVNARYAGTQPYFAAHLQQLPLLKAKPYSKSLS